MVATTGHEMAGRTDFMNRVNNIIKQSPRTTRDLRDELN